MNLELHIYMSCVDCFLLLMGYRKFISRYKGDFESKEIYTIIIEER